MARRSRRRWLALLLLVLLVALLLELNRFLPGVWPGGGGDAGLRRVPTAPGADPRRVEPPAAPTPPTGPREEGTHVVVRLPEGMDGTGDAVSLEVVSAGARRGAEDGRYRVGEHDAVALVDPASGRRVAHGPPPSGTSSARVVVWPRARPPPRPANGSRTFRVTDERGEALAGAVAHLDGESGREARVNADANGRVTVPDDLGARWRACVEAPGHGEACAYGTADAPERAVALPSLLDVSTRFVAAEDGAPLRARSLRLVPASGAAPVDLPAREDGYDAFSTVVAATAARTRDLEVDVDGRPRLRVRLDRVEAITRVPRGRTMAVRLLDGEGRPVVGARVEARHASVPETESAAAPPTASARSDAEGRVVLALPTDAETDVTVSPDALAPASFVVPPGDAAPERDVALAAGVPLRVLVRDEDGRGVPDAEVVAVAAAGSGAARRTARTGADGRATLAPVAGGVVEVHAHAPGRAWAVARADVGASEREVVVALRPGRTLHLVVEDPYGVPIADVRVRTSPRGGGAEPLATPGGPDAADWFTDDAGVLRVGDLPDAEIDLSLSKDGYANESLERVRPGAATWFATLVRTPPR